MNLTLKIQMKPEGVSVCAYDEKGVPVARNTFDSSWLQMQMVTGQPVTLKLLEVFDGTSP